MKKSTFLTVAGLVLFLVAGIWYFVKEEPMPVKQPAAETGSAPGASMTFAGTSLVEERGGKRLWELSAENIEVDPNTKVLRLNNLKAVFYQATGEKVEMTARQGSYDSKTKDILMDGDIVAVAADGSRLTAAQLRYAGQDSRIYGTGGVKVTKADTILTGDKVESDTQLAKVKLSGNAKVIKGGEPQ